MENLLTEFNEGGTHDTNPQGGVPQGIGPNGQQNTVEEGETKFKVGNTPYIFSTRLTNKTSYIDAYTLPTYTDGLSFADASKHITDRFKDRSDNASMSTQKELLNRLVEAQEMARLEKEASDLDISVQKLLELKAEEQVKAQIEQETAQAAEQMTADQEVEEQQGQEQVQGTEQQQFAEGGFSGGQIAGAATGLAGMGVAAADDLSSDQEVRDKMSVGGTAAKYGLMGAAAGSVVPGIGTAIGAGVGAVAGTAIAMSSNSKIAGEEQEYAGKQQGQKLMTAGYKAKYGGALNMYPNGGYLGGDYTEDELANTEENLLFNQEQDALASAISGRDLYNIHPIEAITGPRPSGTVGLGPDIPTSFPEDRAPKDTRKPFNSERATGIGSLIASSAPFVGNLIEGASLQEEEQIRYARTGRTFIPEFADENKAINTVNESYSGIDDSIANASVGNVGAYRANVLGANVGKAKARQSAYSRVNDVNREEQRLLNADAATSAREETSLYNRERIEGKQDKAAYEDAKRAYRTAAYEGLGAMGETIFQVNQQSDTTPYSFVDARRKNQNA